MAERRKSLSKSIRFEVFKRDSFTCQYCGRTAPDVVLEVDHIIPVAKGGDNSLTNLITACFDCNRGKRDKKLTDSQSMKIQKEELDRLNKRKEQLEMMAKWKLELFDIENQEVDKIIDLINETMCINISLTDCGRKNLKKHIKEYGFNEILECAMIAFEQYEDVEIAFSKISGIARNRKMQSENPILRRIYYIRGILRNRLNYINENKVMQLLKEWDDKGLSLDTAEDIAKKCSNWSDWVDTIEEWLESEGD